MTVGKLTSASPARLADVTADTVRQVHDKQIRELQDLVRALDERVKKLETP
jgi:hypothetical protein